MRVAHIERVTVPHKITKEPVTSPVTTFALNRAEQRRYNDFRIARDELATVVRELERNERQRRETEVKGMFCDMIDPFFAAHGIEIAGCFAGYGEDKETYATTPRYSLGIKRTPEEEHELRTMEITYWFGTKDATLNCRSSMSYKPPQKGQEWIERRIVLDMVGRIKNESIQMGTKERIMLDVSGDFIAFAPASEGMSLMWYVKGIVEEVGLDALDELHVLYREWDQERGARLFDDSSKPESIRERVFREAYNNLIETALIKAGFLRKTLRVIK